MSTRLPRALDRINMIPDIAALCVRVSRVNGRPLLLALPQQLVGIDAVQLMRVDGVAGVIWPAREQVPIHAPCQRSGWFLDPPYDWILPSSNSDQLLFLGPRRRLTAKMLISALLAGVRHITYAEPFGWHSTPILRLIGKRAHERGLSFFARIIPPTLSVFGDRLERELALFMKSAQEGNAKRAAVPRRIVFANHSLSLGGTERQIVNTLLGLKECKFDDLTLLCERRHDYSRTDTFGRQLTDNGIAIVELPTVPFPEPSVELLDLAKQFRPGLGRWSPLLSDDVFFFAEMLLRWRPSVLHVWQDITNIKAGLAAVVAGVPRIVLSTRNLSPMHFANWYPWLRPAYRALAGHPGTIFINNSEAGALDYARWLDLPVQCFNVVRNGLARDALLHADKETIVAFRAQHGIRSDLRIVGSIFRFFPEKNPQLWLHVAAEIVRRRPDIRFLLLGSGPLLFTLRRLVERLGIKNHVIFAGEEEDPRVALALMDVFLLVSRAEGLPNVLIEAQAQGVPVVTTEAGGAAEAVDPDRTGLIVHEANTSALASAVLRVLDDSEWADAARRHGPSFVATRFGLASMIHETLRLYGLKEEP
jgi:glycosyltransferase involved in cell wall biosynthesis